jgi:hypothetical protein
LSYTEAARFWNFAYFYNNQSFRWRPFPNFYYAIKGTLVAFVKSPGKREATSEWLLPAQNQSTLHRTTITWLWNSSSLRDNDEEENTKELFYVYSFTQSLFRYDFKRSFKELLKPALIV